MNEDERLNKAKEAAGNMVRVTKDLVNVCNNHDLKLIVIVMAQLQKFYAEQLNLIDPETYIATQKMINDDKVYSFLCDELSRKGNCRRVKRRIEIIDGKTVTIDEDL